MVFIPDYIILNSQHGWIFIMVINNQYYWGFQSRFSAMAIILSKDMIYSTMEGIVPSRCRLTTRHLGATLFELGFYQICKSHVTASMHHGTWGLMQSHFYLPYWRPDSLHRNEPALGGSQLLLSKIQGTQAWVYYIERSTTQLVEYKDLNLMDVGPIWWRSHHMMLLSMNYIQKSLLIIA